MSNKPKLTKEMMEVDNFQSLEDTHRENINRNYLEKLVTDVEVLRKEMKDFIKYVREEVTPFVGLCMQILETEGFLPPNIRKKPVKKKPKKIPL